MGLTEEGLTCGDTRRGVNSALGTGTVHHCSVDRTWHWGKVATSAGNTSGSLSSSEILSAG